MLFSKKMSLPAICLAFVLIGSACGSSDDTSTNEAATAAPTAEETPTSDTGDSATTGEPAEQEPTPEEPDDDGADDSVDDSANEGIDRSELSAAENVALDNIIAAVGERPSVWDGFSLEELPTVVPLLTADGSLGSAFVLFHPNPQGAGDAVPVNGIDGLPDLHYVSQVVDVPQPEKFSFEVDAPIGGVPTYVFPADTDIPVWPAVFVHEGFHVFQIRFWTQDADYLDQQAYDLDARNYELALLEDKALIAAYQSSDDDQFTEAIQHFLALRGTRVAEFPAAALDGQQENIEGTAEWFEWQHTGRFEETNPWSNPNSADLSDADRFTNNNAQDFAGVAPLQRFYQTGATQLELLERLGVDWQPRMELLAQPAQLLADAVPVDPADYASLIGAARQAYDPDGELSALADIWVTAEPREDAEEVQEERAFADAPEEVLTCLADYGLTAEQLDADPSLLTTELNDACIAPYEAKLFECLEATGLDLETLDFDNLPEEALACFN